MVLAAATSHAALNIDGTVSPGEWDAYYLGTSVTGYSGGMTVDVYGYYDATNLYVAYDVDVANSPGYTSSSIPLGVKSQYMWHWPSDGVNHPAAPHASAYLGIWGPVLWYDGDGYEHAPLDWTTIQDPIGPPVQWAGTFTAAQGTDEFIMPWSVFPGAPAPNHVELTGQYFQYDFAEPFHATPEPATLALMALGIGGLLLKKRR